MGITLDDGYVIAGTPPPPPHHPHSTLPYFRFEISYDVPNIIVALKIPQ